MRIRLGMNVEDVLTDFDGVVYGICEYMTGCTQALVVPKVKKDDRKMPESHWVDVDRLRVLKGSVDLPGMMGDPDPGSPSAFSSFP